MQLIIKYMKISISTKYYQPHQDTSLLYTNWQSNTIFLESVETSDIIIDGNPKTTEISPVESKKREEFGTQQQSNSS